MVVQLFAWFVFEASKEEVNTNVKITQNQPCTLQNQVDPICKLV